MSPVDAFGRPQTVLLLGATSEIGLAIVEKMVAGGGRTVILAGRDPTRSTPRLEDVDIDHRYFDATETASHEKFFAEVFADHPRIDTVIVAFGVLHEQREVSEHPELAIEMVNVNHAGAASALFHTARNLRESGGGQIVVLSSIAGLRPRTSNFAYGASKAGIDFLARGLSQSLTPSDVRVLVVRPGFVHSKMTAGLPSRPFSVSPETVGDAVVEGLARNDRVVWVPSILRWVMGVLRMLPSRFVDRLDR
jgi:decaprenylphospho-beta-D-erythro-pentofuranosid-2-ulose 2-reductase